MNKKDELTEIERFCLDGYLMNKNADLAYLLSRSKATNSESEDIIHRMALRWLRSAPVKAYLDERQLILKHSADSSNGGNRNKTDIVSELNALASATPDIKQKTEILMKIADLERMKQETPKEEEQTIHYYLPIRCFECSLYVSKQQELFEEGKLSTQNTDFDPIVRKVK